MQQVVDLPAVEARLRAARSVELQAGEGVFVSAASASVEVRLSCTTGH